MEKDEMLVKRSLRGEKEAFEKLVGKYSSPLSGLIFSKLGRINELEEILQETFARAWINLSLLQHHEKFVPWLNGILHWVCQEKIRDRQKFFMPLEKGDQEKTSSPEEEGNKEAQEDLGRALEDPPDIYRETIVLFYFEKKTYREIGELLGISAKGVNFRLTKARKLLREFLQK